MKIGVHIWLAGLNLIAAQAACAQNYPTKPIRILSAEAGGGVDFMTRLTAQALQPKLGEAVIVDNRNAVVSTETVAKATPDGYTLLITGSSMWTLPFLRDKVSWDPIKDFAPISLLATSPNMIVVHPAVAAKSVQELVAMAKAKPGSLNYGASAGGSTNLAAEQFKAMAGVNLVYVPYKGNGPALNALISGEVQVMFATIAAALPHVKSGRLRGLASTSPQPTPLLPDLPAASAVVPGYSSGTLTGFFAPARTPAVVIKRLNHDVVEALAAADLKKRLFDAGVETVGNSPAEFAIVLRDDMRKMGKVIKDAGIKSE